MCGIAALLCRSDAPVTLQVELWGRLIRSVRDRGAFAVSSAAESPGPDAHGEALHDFTTSDGTTWRLRLFASVLALRGPTTPQPLRRPDGSLFAWNGEVFGGLSVRRHAQRSAEPLQLDDGANDGTVLFNRLDAQNAESLLDGVEGPCAFAWIDQARGRLRFGRDRLGRRSLLIHEARLQLDETR